MRPSDRPVIAEPEERPASRPFATPLGQLFRLRTKACVTCAATFAPTGKGSNRRLYCDACQAQRPDHNRFAPRVCKGCGASFVYGRGRREYCDQCRADACEFCGYPAGRHRAVCAGDTSQILCRGCGEPLSPADRHRRLKRCLACRPNVVTAEEIAATYVTLYAEARRYAKRLVGTAIDAEDVLQATAVSLLIQREALPALTPAIFIQTVRWQAIRVLRRAPRFIPMDLDGLLEQEKINERTRRGIPDRYGWARMPELA